MPEFLTADAMRALEKAAMDSGEVTGAALMECAGLRVVEAIFAKWPKMVRGGQAVVLCGPGNNGGDGFVVARLLEEAGWSVTLFFYGSVAKLPPDARLNHDRWQACATSATQQLGFPVIRPDEAKAFATAAYRDSKTLLVIDALFGIGLTRPLEGLRPLLERAEQYFETVGTQGSVKHVSIDLPSGLAEDGPLGIGRGSVFPVHLTVTFHRRKVAHKQGTSYCGEIIVQDIGL